MLFKDLENINSNIAAELSKHNINEMTDVQAKTYKHIYNNKDLIVCSGTGTGKTLAYLCPIISRLSDSTKTCVYFISLFLIEYTCSIYFFI